MKYIAPDYEIVELKVGAAFADYYKACPEDHGWTWNQVRPCEGKENAVYGNYTFTGLGWDWQCYSSFDQPE